MGKPNEELLTYEELAKATKTSVDSLKRLKAKGMPHVKVGARSIRFYLSDVLEYFNKGEK